jgi:hypothetical protein
VPSKPVQLHHIDDDPSNNMEVNLAGLCTGCHGDTQIKGGFVRKLDAAQVRLYKADWEADVLAMRKASIQEDFRDGHTLVTQSRSHSLVDNTSKGETVIKATPAPEVQGKRTIDWPKPKLLINESFDQSLINDNMHRYDAGHGMSWHPSKEEPQQHVILGFPSYSKEFKLKSSFRSFTALVSPNAENFRLVMKLMNETGKLPAHMNYGEASFILKDDAGAGGMILGYQEGGETYERPIPVIPRPRFNVDFKVFPIQASKLLAAQLYINQKLVQSKMIPREFTARFGIVASGNGKLCHMSFSEIGVCSVAK